MCGTKDVKNILRRELRRYSIGEEAIEGMKEYEMMALLSFMLSGERDRNDIIKRAAERELAPPAYLNLLKVL